MVSPGHRQSHLWSLLSAPGGVRRSRCKIDAVYFPRAQHLNVERRLKPRVPLLPFKHRAVGNDIGDIKVESEKSRVAAFSLDVSLI